MSRLFLNQQRRGAVTVEVAICLPVLFLFVFFSLEISRAYFVRQAISNAAYEACRAIKVPGAHPSEAHEVIDSILSGVGVDDYQTQIVPSAINEATSQVTVSISVPLSANMSLATPFFKNVTLNSSATLKTERYRR
jgi:Flp pilus assembly protein TadG